MKKIVIAILTILFITLPLFSMENRKSSYVCILLWAIVSILLFILYFKWFNPNNISYISEKSKKYNNLKKDEKDPNED